MDVAYVVRVKKNARIGGRSASFMCERNRWKKWSGELHKAFGEEVHFAVCYRWGEKLEKDAGIKLKKHGYRAKSLFRRGFESLHRMLAKPPD